MSLTSRPTQPTQQPMATAPDESDLYQVSLEFDESHPEGNRYSINHAGGWLQGHAIRRADGWYYDNFFRPTQEDMEEWLSTLAWAARPAKRHPA